MSPRTGPSWHHLNPVFGRVLFAFLCLAFAAGVFAPSHGARAAFPTTGILDNFNRADESPVGNGHWTGPIESGHDQLMITSSKLTPIFSDTADSYWSSASFGPDTEAFVTIATKPDNGQCIAVVCKIANPNTASLNAYQGEFCDQSGTDTWDIYKFTNGTPSALVGTTNVELSAGDSIGLECKSGSQKLKRLTGGTWADVNTAADTTYDAVSGYIGVHMEASTGRADDFGGGTVVTQGVQVSSRSDTLSDSRPSATSNHTVAFKVNNAIYGSSMSGSSTLTLTLPSGFTIPVGMDCSDVDAATSVQFSFNYPGCASTATAWGFTAAGSLITLVPPSGTGVYVPTSTQVTIKIGSNATVGQQGGHWITNPSAGGVYTISVGGDVPTEF